MALLWVCFFQTIAIGWVFGAERFCDCVEQMTGIRPNMFWYLCWKYFAPLVMFAVFIFYCISYSPVTYGHDYVYPNWAEILGLLMSFSSMIWVPGYAIYYVLTQPGTIMEVMQRDTVHNVTCDKCVIICAAFDAYTLKCKILEFFSKFRESSERGGTRYYHLMSATSRKLISREVSSALLINGPPGNETAFS